MLHLLGNPNWFQNKRNQFKILFIYPIFVDVSFYELGVRIKGARKWNASESLLCLVDFVYE